MTDEQGRVTRVYDRVAPFYDLYDAPMDWLGGRRRRRRVLGQASGPVLEVGIGTGRNLGLYPEGVGITGIDISARMLARAERRRVRERPDARLLVADAGALPFGAGTFESVTATCVFCSIVDPVRALREVARVTKDSGRVLLLEHVRPRNPLLGRLFDWLTPLTRRLIGPEINRRTEENVAAAGLETVKVRRAGIWREIVARPRPAA